MLVNGKKYAEDIKHSLVNELAKSTQTLSFHIIYIGSDPVIDNFIQYKKKFGAELGIEVTVHRFLESVGEEEIKSAIDAIVPISTGIIVQLPLPVHLDNDRILAMVPSTHDVDVLSRYTREKFSRNETDLVPPVTGAIIEIFKRNNISLEGKNIIMVGNGSLVGYPTGLWLTKEGYPYTIITEETAESERLSYLENAEVIISGVGIPGLITPSMIREGAICIDAGTSESGKKIQGDFEPHCASRASLFTPVPGGIGPMTIALLYRNLIRAHLNNHHD